MTKLSILTPTYNRFFFLKLLAFMINGQTIDLKNIEWIIVDDSEEDDRTDYFRNHPIRLKLKQLVYVYMTKKMTIGQKRNLCNLLANGDILVHMDDDDYYHSNYLELVNFLFENRKEDVVGASEISIIYPESKNFFFVGPYGKMRTCGGIMSYRRDYALQNHYNNYKKYGEEIDFLNNFNTPIFQIPNSYNYNLVLSHSSNTIDKSRIERKDSNLCWIDFVINNEVLILSYLSIYPDHLSIMNTPKGWSQIAPLLLKAIDEISTFSNDSCT